LTIAKTETQKETRRRSWDCISPPSEAIWS